MKSLYKGTLLLLGALLVFSGCQGQQAPETTPSVDLQAVNEFLNTSAGLGPGTIGNEVRIVPHAHIDGPRNETDFYAFVTFKYKSRDFIKYQVTYLSCTCRPAPLNVWQTMYVEMTLPDSKDPKDTEIKFISFDEESTEHYTGGFWGDSDPMPNGQTYDLFAEQYIPYFEGKTAEYVESLSVVEDIAAADYQSGEGREDYTIDTLAGASVSSNNIIRILHSVLAYHASDEYFAQ